MRREGFRFRFDLAPGDPGLRRVARLMLPAAFGLAATQLNILVDTSLASSYGDGPITWLSLAFRLMQLPLGLFGVAIATANLARVSRDAAVGDTEGMRTNLATSLRAAALLTLPATAGLVALRLPIARLLFQHGRFTAEDSARTGGAILCYALGLYAYSVTKIQVPTFYALGDTRRPVIASAIAVAAKIGLNLVAFFALSGVLGRDAFLSLALTTSTAAWLNLAFLSRGLRSRLGPLSGHRVLQDTLKIALLSGAMGIACGLSHAFLERSLGGGGVPGDALRLIAVVGIGVAISAGGASALRIREGMALVARIRSFASRGPRR